MTKNRTSNAVERERSNTELQLEVKRHAVRELSRAIATLERERRDAQVMVDFYSNALALTPSSRHRSAPILDYRTFRKSVAQQ